MHIRKSPRWQLKQAEATPESVYLNRRQIMAGGLAAGAIAASGGLGISKAFAQEDRMALEAARNDAYQLDRDLTPEKFNLEYNNFYEFGSHKEIASAAQALEARPWEVTIDGMVEKPIKMDIDELMAKMTLEERLYRHRCVEAWSMTVPWIGFPLRKLVEMAAPTSGAKYVRMETFNDPSVARGIKTQPWYPWPYVEGLTMAEATNDLAFLVVGAYGKVVADQMGAPLRLAVPWKYGFKSIKSIVRFEFTDQQPVSFWEQLQAREYGFWANVNPEVPHPRWSQARERVLHTGEYVPTQLFNGYGEEVASLYTGMEDLGDRLYR
ncbi:protein-methionine-sulfoxide reductase catalytic subunit MsrP [Maritalea mediterranea]|uniref:Protein-methionine-sulfoxide reductase catalytic subunit MsrP n=1 Tax=Maritalea mediterranea TaxID=2909667 RepID=A0ABS9EA01_9HYPH|nr:protein-methionine-sulfoxide reductase catalytic subunit MsrP [Maritalea mediterranea]MCF4099024.1 protein-methionine-sulfoxide reductase catalytic subunit MsrP [Maritalea mediterranea]